MISYTFNGKTRTAGLLYQIINGAMCLIFTDGKLTTYKSSEHLFGHIVSGKIETNVNIENLTELSFILDVFGYCFRLFNFSKFLFNFSKLTHKDNVKE